jgi:hypothetical protein
VVWDNVSSGSLGLTSTQGDTTLTVQGTTPLSGGSIVGSLKTQSVQYNAMPGGINCSPASGGACSPNYTYQWQESVDNVNWTDIKGATGQNLGFTASKKQTVYCRRKVTEIVSGSIAYSDVAMVDVGPQPATSTATTMTRSGLETDLVWRDQPNIRKSF